LIKSFFRIESYKRGIVFSSGFNILAKAFAFISNLLIAYYFGTQAKTDVYFYCFTTIALVAALFTSIDSSVLIPESMRLREQNSKEDSIIFLNLFLYIYLFLGILFTIILYINPVLILTTISHFKKELLLENSIILLLSIPLVTLIILCTFIIDILTSYKFFTIPMIAQMLNSIFAIAFIILLHASYGVLSILIGILFAYVFQFGLLIFLMKKYLAWKFSFKFVKINIRILKNILFAQCGNITSTLTSYIPLFLLSGFNAGVITALNYGQKTADMPNQFITTQFSSVTGIKYNELVARKDYEGLNRVFQGTAKFLLFILIPISIFIFIYSKELISILYHRGRFDINSVQITADFLKYFGLLLPFLAINTLIARLFMAYQKIKEAFWYQVISNILTIIFIIEMVNYLGVIGYPIALVITQLVFFFLNYYLLRLFFKDINYKIIMIDYFIILFINIIIGSIIYLLVNNTFGINSLLQILSGIIIYTLLLLVANTLLNIIPVLTAKNIFNSVKLLIKKN
jgi:murein biosynthesis integral membrane protein MurJ